MLEEYKDQLKGVEIEEIAQSVKIFKREFLILNWLHLYVGSRGVTVKKVVGELYRLYPDFQHDIEGQGRSYPADGLRLRFEDEDYFQSWLRDNSSYFGNKWGVIAWLGLVSKEINWFYAWRKNQRYQPGGFEFISFQSWYERMKLPPDRILAEVKVTPEDYKMVSKGLPSVAQLYADHGGRVAIVRDSTLDIKTEKLLKAEEVAELLQVSVKTIYNWVSEGTIPCYSKEKKMLRFKWDEVEKGYSQYEQKGRKSRSIEVE